MKIESMRKKIDHLDKKLLRTLVRRFQASRKIGQMKAKNNLPVEDKERERELLESVKKRAKSLNLNSLFVEKMFKEILVESKNQQKILKK